jgi:ribosomal protein S18 acetylase RimI-like enzyme
MKIRQADLSDAGRVIDFNARLAEETEHRKLDRLVLDDGVRAALSDSSKPVYFLAEIDGRVVGQLMITHEWSDWRNGDIWWIQSVYVDPDFRRRGVFKALYEHVREQARKSGAAGIRLYVERNNLNAQRTYENLGMSMTKYLVMEDILRDV